MLFTLMVPSETVGPPGGRHEGAAVKMRVPTLGSVRRPVASAPAPGAVGTWSRIRLHGTTEIAVLTTFYKGFSDALGHRWNACSSTVSAKPCNQLVL